MNRIWDFFWILVLNKFITFVRILKLCIMTIVIKKGATKEEVEKLLLEVNKNPKKKKSLWNVYGKHTIEGDAVEIQKKLRNEWD